MAIIKNPRFRRSKKDPVIVYFMRGNVYMRAKSSLSRKRVLTDPAFAPLRYHSGVLATASPIASEIYKGYTPRQKKRFSSQFLTGRAMRLLKSGWKPEDAANIMKELYSFRSIVQSGIQQVAAVAAPLNELQLSETIVHADQVFAVNTRIESS